MRRSPFQTRSLLRRALPRIRNASFCLARVALVCYLMPVILLVFAIGILAIGVGHLHQYIRSLGDLLPTRDASLRGLVALPVSRKEIYHAESGPFRKPRIRR